MSIGKLLFLFVILLSFKYMCQEILFVSLAIGERINENYYVTTQVPLECPFLI